MLTFEQECRENGLRIRDPVDLDALRRMRESAAGVVRLERIQRGLSSNDAGLSRNQHEHLAGTVGIRGVQPDRVQREERARSAEGLAMR